MRTKLLLAAAMLCPSAGALAAPSDINAQAFYADARALEAKGMAAMFDKRMKPMVAQMKDAGERSRTANLAARAAGKPLYCVPEGAKRGMGAKQVITMLGKLPEAERRSLTLADAWKRALSREYPCR